MTVTDTKSSSEIWQEALHFAEEGRDSSNRSLALLESTVQIGATTLESLHHQGEQLKNVQPKVAQIHEDLDEATKKLRTIKSVFGGVKNRMKSSFKKKSSSRRRAQETLDADIQKIRENASDKQAKEAGRRKAPKQTSIVIDSDHPDALRVKEVTTQTDDNLDRMSSLLDDLKSQAEAMSVEIGVQNRRLDTIQTGVSEALSRVQRATNKTRSLR